MKKSRLLFDTERFCCNSFNYNTLTAIGIQSRVVRFVQIRFSSLLPKILSHRGLVLAVICSLPVSRKDKPWPWEQVNHSIWSGVPVIHINHYKFVALVQYLCRLYKQTILLSITGAGRQCLLLLLHHLNWTGLFTTSIPIIRIQKIAGILLISS